jgi:hypothetical protein
VKKTGYAILFILWIILAPALTQKANLTEANPYTPPEPTIPEFTLKYTDNSYNVAGNFVQNKSIEVTIKNQPTGYILCYNVKSKSNFSENWTSYEYYDNSSYLTPQLFLPNRLLAWNSTMTVLVFGFEGNNGSDNYNLMLGKVNEGAKMDFQVQAYIGNWFPGRVVNATASIDFYSLNIDATGDWSPPQTITIQESSIPEPTPQPATFPASLIFVASVGIALAVIGLLVYFKKRQRQNSVVK